MGNSNSQPSLEFNLIWCFVKVPLPPRFTVEVCRVPFLFFVSLIFATTPFMCVGFSSRILSDISEDLFKLFLVMFLEAFSTNLLFLYQQEREQNILLLFPPFPHSGHLCPSNQHLLQMRYKELYFLSPSLFPQNSHNVFIISDLLSSKILRLHLSFRSYENMIH